MDQEQRRARVRELHSDLERSIAALVDSDDWRAMLETAAHFHRYSPNNVMLIHLQCPHATRVAGYRTWQSLNRHVRRGEHGIKVMAPCKYKRRDEETGEDVWRLAGFTVDTNSRCESAGSSPTSLESAIHLTMLATLTS